MSILRLQALLRRARRRTAALAVLIVAIGAATAQHHAMPMDMHMTAAAVCLAVVGVAAAVPTRIGGVLRRPYGLMLASIDDSLVVPGPRSVPARAGPALPLVLRL